MNTESPRHIKYGLSLARNVCRRIESRAHVVTSLSTCWREPLTVWPPASSDLLSFATRSARPSQKKAEAGGEISRAYVQNAHVKTIPVCDSVRRGIEAAMQLSGRDPSPEIHEPPVFWQLCSVRLVCDSAFVCKERTRSEIAASKHHVSHERVCPAREILSKDTIEY